MRGLYLLCHEACGKDERIIALCDAGMLVPDDRLQTIANAWSAFNVAYESSDRILYEDAWTKLEEVLDALTEETKEEQ